MKNLREVATFLISNAGIGIVAIVSIVGLFVGGLYIIELVEKLFVQFVPLTTRMVLSIGISSIIALYFLAVFGSWVREKIEDIIREVHSQRKVIK